MHHVTRRSLLGSSLGLGAAAVLSSCGDSSPSSPEEQAAATSSVLPTHVPYTEVEPDLPAEDGVSPAAFTAYPADPAQFSTETPGDGEPITFSGPTSFGLPPAMGDNPFWQEMNERIGSEMQISLTPAADYDSKFATMVAGDSLPEAFYVGNMPARNQFLTAKVADLTEHLAGDAISEYPGLANIPSESWKECIIDGTIRAIPLQRGLVGLNSVLMRNDLLAAEGIDKGDITDFESLREISQQLTGGNSWAWADAPIAHIRRMCDIPITWTISDGVLGTTLLDDRQEQALEAARTLVEDGSVTPDAAGTPASTKKQWFGGGQVTFMTDSFIAWFSLYIANSGVEGLDIQAMGIPGMEGDQGTQNLPKPNAGFTAFSAEVGDRLPTLLRVADWLAAPFGTQEYLLNKYGLVDRHYTLDGSDPVPTDLATEVNIGSLYYSDAARVIYSPGRPEAVQDSWEHQNAVNTKSVSDPTYGLHSETGSRNLGSLMGDLRAVEEDIIFGRKEISAWKPAAQKFLDDCGTKILEEYQASYDATEGQE